MAIAVAILLAAGAGFAALLSYPPSEERHVMGRLLRALPLAAAASLGGTGHAAMPLPPPPPLRIGMNPPGLADYETTAAFANLARGEPWTDSRNAPLAPPQVDFQGALLASPAGGGDILRTIRAPTTGPGGVTITCTWQGAPGVVDLAGNGFVGKVVNRDRLSYHLTNIWTTPIATHLVVRRIDPAQPLRNLDCREADVPATAIYRPHYLATMTGWPVLRFMEWQRVNDNGAVRWADRHLPTGIEVLNRDGASLEDMLELARLTNSDPWFCMPWNADADYIAHFAKMVHDRLPKGRRVYVEVSNEVWNAGFRVSQQAQQEGLAEGLSNEPGEAQVRRYAERVAEVMKIWEAAFPDRTRLVRVLGALHVWSPPTEIALAFRDTAAHVDAIATAPYFGDPIEGMKDVPDAKDAIFARYRASVAKVLDNARSYRALALRYGKRYITYEGGQGMILPGAGDLMRQVQHDPRMYEVYRTFLTGWRRDIGDLLCLLTSAAPLGEASWGLADYEGQPLADAPKLRAVMEARRTP